MFRRDEPAGADLERFEQLVIGDDELTEALWREQDPRAFVELVVRLAAGRSLRIRADDVQHALHHGRERWWKRYAE